MHAVLKDALNTAPLNTYGGPDLASFEISLIGAHRCLETYTVEMPGVSNNTIQGHTVEMPSVCRVFNTIELEMPGRFDLAIVKVTIEMPGVCQRFVTYEPTLPGVSRLYGECIIEMPGVFNTLKEMEIALVGVAQYGLGHVIDLPGEHSINQKTYLRVYRQGYRVADTTLETLELYAGYDEMPDFDDVAQPVATGDPISWTPTYPGTGLTTILNLVVRKRNRYNLLSHNQQPELIEIDENGDPVLGPLTAPEFVKVMDGSAVGSIQVWARYPYEGDRNPADTWEVYAAIGVDPVVGVDTPVLTQAISGTGGGLIPWRGVVTGLTTGATYHILIAIRRQADDAYAESSVLEHALAVVYTVDAGDLTVFAGDEYEIQQ